MKNKKQKNLKHGVRLLKLELEARDLEIELQGALIATLQKQIHEMLAVQEHRLRAVEQTKEPVVLKGAK